MNRAMIFVYVWFGCGVFVAAMALLQWSYDGYPVHAESNGNGEGERYYYLKGLITNVIMSLLTGPLVLFIQFTRGMPLIPRKGK